VQEILPNIYTWSWFSATHDYNFNGYLVCDEEGNLCIDPVQPGGDLAEIERLGVAKIVLTNRNHSRASNLLRERTNAPVYMHPDDAAYAVAQGTPVDGELLIGEKIGPLVIEPAPGKSPGEVVLHWPERRLLFVGDAVIGNPPGACGLLREQVIDDLPRLRRSLRNLLELDFDALLVGDGAPILHDAKARLSELVARFP